VKVKIFLY